MRGATDWSVYLVTDPGAPHGVVETAIAAARGGASIVQLRDKTASDADLVATARVLQRALAPFAAKLIINDRVDVARAVAADGLHIGQSDGDAAAARRALGPAALIGLSIENPDQLAAVDWSSIDYVGAGPVRATTTKPDHAPPIGFDGLARIAAAAQAPVIAIGGLGLGDAAPAKAAGAAGLAVVSAICSAEDPETAARGLSEEWRAA